MPPSRPENDRIAVFIDAENLIISAQQAGLPLRMELVMDSVREEGVVSFARAYGDWSQAHMKPYQQDFLSNVIEMSMLATSYEKNTGDMQIACDALEMALIGSAPHCFVIVGGDRDFVPLVQKLKRYGMRVIGIGLRRTTSQYLDKVCDQFLYYDKLVGELDDVDSSAAAATPAPSGNEEPGLSEEHLLFDLMLRAVVALERKGVVPNGTSVNNMMRQLDPKYTALPPQYHRFRDLAEAAQEDGFVTIRQGSGLGFELESARKYTRSLPSASTPVRLAAFDAPDDDATLLSRYRSILQEKGVPLIPWEQREKLIRSLWEEFESNPQPFSMHSINHLLMDLAARSMYQLPDRACQKLTHTMNIGHCFLFDGQMEYRGRLDFYEENIRPAVDVEQAVRRVNRTYLTGMLKDDPGLELRQRPLSMLLFSDGNDAHLHEVDSLLQGIRQYN
ncbi:NYN domain-containing protein [bacterium]|nr:NYN domain-containing protein [bacterium]